MRIPGRAAAVLSLAFVVVAFGFTSLSFAGEVPVTILLYHRFGESKYPSTSISKESLIDQLKFLQIEGYTVIGLNSLSDIIEGRVPATGKEVLITVDDGYKSVYETAWPAFRKFNVPFTVFLSTRPIESGYPSMMTWDMIREMADAGVVFANHSHTHAHMGQMKDGESENSYKERVREEISKAESILGLHGISNSFFAYPYGEYNRVITGVLKDMGYKFMFSQNPGVAYAGCDKTRISRMAIVGGEMPVKEFALKLSRLPLLAVKTEPEDVEHEGVLSGIELKIANPGDYLPGQVNLFVSELGRLEPVYDRKTGILKVNGPIRLERYLNRIILTAREKESRRFGMASWLLLRQ